MAEKKEPVPAIQTIVLLEQNKIEQNDPNGTFSINLKHPVTLNDGDAINLSKSFIDTSTEDINFISVTEDDADVVITSGLYFNDLVPNTPAVNPTDKPTFGEWSVPLAQRPRGTTYICSNHSEANLHTFLTWEQTNNTFAPTPGSASFSVELTTIDAAYVTANPSLASYLGVAHYVITGKPDLGDAPTDPTAADEVIQQKFILGGFVNNVTINNKHEFFFYHRSTLATEIDETNQNHVAVLDIWATDQTQPTKTQLGWRGKANSSTTFPISAGQPVLGKWQFLSDADGYNYFSDGGKSHVVNLDTIKFPFDSNWTAGLSGNPDFVPGVEITWNDASATPPKTTSLTKSFTKYIPRTEYPADEGQGITTLIKQLDDPKSPYKPSKFIKHDDLPKSFREGNGWGRNWYWYEWTDWLDPLDPTSQRTFPRLEFDLKNPPILGTPTYEGGKPIDRAFGNKNSQFATFDAKGVWQGNELQPFQMVLSPVSNPTSQGCTLTPRVYTTKFRIPPRDYTYSDLAQFITDKLNNLESPVLGLQNNPNDVNCPLNAAGFSNSYLLQDTSSLSMQYDGLAVGATFPKAATYPNNYTFSAVELPDRIAPNVNTGDPENLGIIQPVTSTDAGVQPYWVSEDGTSLFRFDKDNVFKGVNPFNDPATDDTQGPRVVGAENFSLIFDDSSSKFQILEAHTPIYIDGPILSATGQTPVVKGPGSAIIKQMGGGPNASIGFRNEQLTIDTSSGVFLYDLQPRSLWFEKMGFDASILTPTSLVGGVHNFATTGSSFVGGDGSLLESKTYPVSLKPGVNRTGFFKSVDLLIQKNNEFAKIDASGGQDVETATPVGLDASPLIDAGDDQPFYSIEMSGINNQDFMGQPFNNSLIQGLVGKYYSQGNFTESESDGIQYIHRGEPLVIQSIRTRILNTQLELEPKLGTNSAFILTIEKTK